MGVVITGYTDDLLVNGEDLFVIKRMETVLNDTPTKPDKNLTKL